MTDEHAFRARDGRIDRVDVNYGAVKDVQASVVAEIAHDSSRTGFGDLELRSNTASSSFYLALAFHD